MLRGVAGGATAGAVTTAGTLTSGQVAYGSGAQTITSSTNLTYDNTAATLAVGSGTTTSMGMQISYAGLSGFSGLYATGVTPSSANARVMAGGVNTYLGAIAGNIYIRPGGSGASTGLIATTAGLVPEANGAIDLGDTSHGYKRLYVDYTITAAAATGNKTINKAAGTIRIAAAGTSVTLTNSLVTANSIVMATLATVDTTAKSVTATVSSTSVLFTLNAAAGAEVEIRWFVVSTD